MKHLLSEANRIAGKINTWLLVIAIGLAALDLSIYVGLGGVAAPRSWLTEPLATASRRLSSVGLIDAPGQIANH